MIVVIEGGDACGKATQTKILVERLRDAGRHVESRSFPDYGSPTGKLILRMLKGEVAVGEWKNVWLDAYSFEGRLGEAGKGENALVLQALMLANRHEQYADLVRWAWSYRDRKVPDVLVLDRYWLSGYAYGVAAGLDRDWLLAVHAALPAAHHVILDVDPEEALRRRPEVRDRHERDRGLQERVREIYRKAAACPPLGLDGRVHLVDGQGTVEEVSESVWAVVSGLVA